MGRYSESFGSQYQRKANPLEGLLDALQKPTQAIAGAVDFTLSGNNPIEGAMHFMRENKDFIQMLKDRGVADAGAITFGLAMNIASDPLTYVGIGNLTKAGKLAREARMGIKIAEKGDAVEEFVSAAVRGSEAGILASKWSEQAALKQRALLSLGGQPVIYGDKVLKAMETMQTRVGNSIVGKAVGRTFSTFKGMVPEDVLLSSRQAKSRAAKKSHDLGQELAERGNAFYNAMKALGVPDDTARDMLRDSIEKARKTINNPAKMAAIQGVISKYSWGARRAGVSRTLKEAVDYVNKVNAEYLASEVASGVLTSELAGNLGFLHRMFTPEARDAYIATHADELRNAGSSYDVSVRFASQLQRSDVFRELTITEINRMGEAGELTSLFGGAKVKVFEDEPFFATFVRGTQSHKAVESANLVNDVMRQYGQEIIGDVAHPLNSGHAPVGMGFLSARIAEDLGIRVTTTAEDGRKMVLRDMALPKDIIRLLESHYERVIHPQAVQPALRAYDSLQRIWKSITLPIWPAYHNRNLLSDFLMITHNADDYGLNPIEAVQSIKDAAFGLAKGTGSIRIGEQVLDWTKARQLLDKYGIIDYAPGRELDDLLLTPRNFKNVRKGLLGVEERLMKMAPMHAAMNIGMYRQNTINAGYFIGLLRKGVSPEIAALEVKKRLFDYSDLTDIEKQVLRRVFPFYAWLRHNIPYQLSAIGHKPRILTGINWVRDAATGGEGPASDMPLPSFLAQGLPIQLPGGQPGVPNYARLKGLLPTSDIMTVFNPINEAQNAVSPLLKTPYEMLANVDTFQNTELETYPGQAKKFLGVPVSKRWAAPVLNTLRPLYEVNNLLLPERSALQKAGGLLLTKGYGMDEQRQHRLMMFRVREEQLRVRKLMHKAAQQGDSGEIIKLRRYLLDLSRNPRQVMK